MPYVLRDANKKVIAIYLGEQPDAPEILPIEHPDIIDFLTQAGEDDNAKRLLSEYDASIPRVLEDLIDILIRNQVVRFEQFPSAAQRKLLTRQYLRNLIRQVERNVGEED